MNNRITFLSNVIILDVSFLNGTVADAKHVLEENLRRKLPDTDIVDGYSGLVDLFSLRCRITWCYP